MPLGKHKMDSNKYYKKREDSGCWGLQTLPLIHAESQEETITRLHDTLDPEVKLFSWWGSSDFLYPLLASKSNFNCRTHCAYLTRATESLILSRWQEAEGRTTVQTCGPWGKALSAPQPPPAASGLWASPLPLHSQVSLDNFKSSFSNKPKPLFLSVIPRPAESARPGNLLVIQILRHHPQTY